MVAFFRFSLEGECPIEVVELGDYVPARDEEAGEFAWKPIFQRFAIPEPVIEIRFEDKTGNGV